MAYRDLEQGRMHDRERFRKRNRRTPGARIVSPMWRSHSRARAQSLRSLCREATGFGTRPRCPAASRGNEAPPESRQRTRSRSAGDRRAGRAGAHHEARQGACGAGPPPLPRMHRQAPSHRPRPLRPGQGCGYVVRWQRPGSQTQPCPERSRKRHRDRIASTLCTRCGRQPISDGSTVCEPFREVRCVSDRERYGTLRAAGPSVTCGQPALAGEARCSVCAAVEGERCDRNRKNEASRRWYAERRAKDACTDCSRPAHGVCRCAECAKRSYERPDFFRGIPVWELSFTMIELATGECHGPFDTEAEAGLVFAKLSFDQVEIVSDAPVTATLIGWA